MVSDVPTGQVSDLDWLLSGLVQRPFTRHALAMPVKSVRPYLVTSARRRAGATSATGR